MRLAMLGLILAACVGSAWSAEEKKDDGAAWKAMFPNGLQDAKGQPVSLDQLKGKVVGIYFSAHWCPPCRAFTPKLVQFRDKNARDFEIVFVSSDRSEKDQQGYMAEAKMQWPTVKLNSAEANALKKKFEVAGIPKLVILNAKGELITDNGRGEVTSKAGTVLDEWKKK